MISVGGSSSRARISRMIRPATRPMATPPTPVATNFEHRLHERERAGDHRRDGEPVQHERRPVVGQVLALDDGDQPPRRADAAHDLGGRHGVRRATRSRRARTPGPSPARSTAWRPRATAPIVTRTSGIDSSAIGFALRRRSRTEVKKAAPYRSGGRKISSTRSGSSVTSGHARQEADHRAAGDERDRVGHAQQPGEDREAGDRQQAARRRSARCAPRAQEWQHPRRASGHALRQARLPSVRRRARGGRARSRPSIRSSSRRST